MTIWLRIGEVAQEFGVTSQTIRNWEKQGEFRSKRTYGGHRRYEKKEIDKKLGIEQEENYTITYARVSSSDQKEDLERQKKELEEYCQEKGIEKRENIWEIGSGINYKKRGIKKLIEWILSGKVERVVVSYKDRLVRFGGEIIEQICKAMNVSLVIINDRQEASFEEELARDVLTILTVFCSKIYGKRSHERRKKREESKEKKEEIRSDISISNSNTRRENTIDFTNAEIPPSERKRISEGVL